MIVKEYADKVSKIQILSVGLRNLKMRLFLKNMLLSLCLLTSCAPAMAYTYWPMWEQFKQYYISKEGRVIDPQLPEQKTTSEGQSYALFFALVAQDKKMFDQLLHWSQSNLAGGDLGKHLPAWAWGQNAKKKWGVLDSNSATDSDLWFAYNLLEAGRLWKNKAYTALGKKMLHLILKEEVVLLPGFGLMALPGKYGFNFKDSWRLNPSYLPPQLLARFAGVDKKWNIIQTNSMRLLLETSPKGFAPDWVLWKKNQGWKPDLKYPNLGSYDAIRVYLWIGMLADDAPQALELKQHFYPMIRMTQQLGVPPEKIDIMNGKAQGRGSLGFSASLLPLLRNSPSISALQKQILDKTGLSADSYYSSVLRLFGQGFEENRYRFNAHGELLLPHASPAIPALETQSRQGLSARTRSQTRIKPSMAL